MPGVVDDEGQHDCLGFVSVVPVGDELLGIQVFGEEEHGLDLLEGGVLGEFAPVLVHVPGRLEVQLARDCEPVGCLVGFDGRLHLAVIHTIGDELAIVIAAHDNEV